MNAYTSLEISVILLAFGYFTCAYLLGSIPVAWLIARWTTGQDLRQMGSGNVGVMNTALSVARWAGLLAFLGEIAKGVLAVVIPQLLGADEYLVWDGKDDNKEPADMGIYIIQGQLFHPQGKIKNFKKVITIVRRL